MSIAIRILLFAAMFLADIFLFTYIAEALRASSDWKVFAGIGALLVLVASNLVLGKFINKKL
jgi:multidrug transporter EmrE-like cation transporter